MTNNITFSTKWRRYLINIFTVVIVFAGLHAYQTRSAAQGRAPEIQGVSLNGNALSLYALAGKPVLVHFWATWCPMCRLENASIEAISKNHSVISVVIDDAASEEIVAYMRNEQLTYPTLHDATGNLASRYGVGGVPASYIVDKTGEIRFVEIGYTTEFGLRFRLWWAGFWH